MKKLPLTFFQRRDVLTISRELLGKILVSQIDGKRVSGRIVETEAYEGEVDMASHAFRGLTPRTKTMFGAGGHAYVYLCYGIHQMFNIVTSLEGEAHAILIRAVEPLEGVEVMLQRTGKSAAGPDLTSGPGKVGKAFGFHTSQCGEPLTGEMIFVADDGYEVGPEDIVSSPRIGVQYAGEHALWHYRFFIRNNPYVSRGGR